MYDASMLIEGFQWDIGNLAKCQKHGVSIEEIEALFSSGTLIEFPDPHPDEARSRGIGRSDAGRHIFVVWTIRTEMQGKLIRPISARYMHAKEIEHYEQEHR